MVEHTQHGDALGSSSRTKNWNKAKWKTDFKKKVLISFISVVSQGGICSLISWGKEHTAHTVNKSWIQDSGIFYPDYSTGSSSFLKMVGVFYGFNFLQFWGLNPGSGSCSISILLLENNTQPWHLLYSVNFPCCRLSPSNPYGLPPVAKLFVTLQLCFGNLKFLLQVLELWMEKPWGVWRDHKSAQCRNHSFTVYKTPHSSQRSQLSKMCGEWLSVKAALQFLEGRNPP